MRPSRTLIGLALLLATTGLAGESIVYENDFSSDLGEWEFWASTSPTEPHTYVVAISSDVGGDARRCCTAPSEAGSGH
ncbi:MAG: hypothetical protein GY898_13095 [Proteobacteria bacterium]|nr:hypothetical protein [Pseudomonadota bacterium]